MRVLIDGQSTTIEKSGFGSYVSNLLENVPRIDTQIEYEIVQPAHHSQDLTTPQRLYWDQVSFAKATFRPNIDLIHQPAFSAPIISRRPIILTVHDCIANKFPQNLSLPSRIFFTCWMPFTQRRASHILTVSECSKRDLIDLLHVPAEKITVTPLAASSTYRLLPKESVEQIKQKYSLTKPYFLHVGTLEPRKNLIFLVEAYAAARQNNSALQEELVITGKKGWWYQSLFATVHNLGLDSLVHFTGYVPEVDLPSLYAGATAFCFPSIYEGFGLPPLEAMQCGTAVISSNTSSLPEVVGKAGILLAPDDIQGWSEALQEISNNAKLRRQLSQQGLEQAKRFSWDSTAKLTAEVYERVYRKQYA